MEKANAKLSTAVEEVTHEHWKKNEVTFFASHNAIIVILIVKTVHCFSLLQFGFSFLSSKFHCFISFEWYVTHVITSVCLMQSLIFHKV